MFTTLRESSGASSVYISSCPDVPKMGPAWGASPIHVVDRLESELQERVGRVPGFLI